MQLIKTKDVYSFILTEDEWYSGTEQQKLAWEVQCKREAEEAGARYASVMVEPSPVMSISPIPHRHKVWGFTFSSVHEEAFKADLRAVLAEYAKKLTIDQMCRLARGVFG